MKKILLLLCTLLTGVCGAGAETYTAKIVDGTNNPKGTLNTVSGTTMTSTATSGFEGVVISNIATIDQGTWNSIRYMVVKPSAAQTADKVTITAPEGYLITGFTMNCCNYSSNCPYYVSTNTDSEFSTATATALVTFSSSTTISVSDIESPSTGFWFYCNASSLNWMMVSSFEVYLKVDDRVDVTYKVVDEANGTVLATATAKLNKGTSLSLPSSATRDYCTYTYYSDAACTTAITEVSSNTATVFALASYELPFTPSTSFSDATWYYAYERTSTQLYYSASGITTGTNESTNGEKWAFIGDPYHGVKVINGAAGSGKFLTHNATALSWDETGTNWSIMAHPKYPTAGFVLYDVVGGDTYTIYLGAGGAVTALQAAITSSNDNVKGGCIELTAVPDDYKARVASEITPYFSALDVYYGMTTASANSLKSTYTYWDGETSCTETEFNTLYNAVMAAIVYPQAGKYYRIKNYSTNNYMGMEESGSVATFASGATASTVVYMSESSDVTKLTMQGAEAYSTVTFTLGAPGLATILDNTGGSAVYSYLRDNGSNAVTSWNVVSTTDTPQAYWSIEDAETVSIPLNTVGNQSYATFCAPFDVTLDGATAYTLTKDGEYLLLSEGLTTVAAGTPVLLIGTGSSATATIGSNYSTTISTSTALTGTYLEIADFDGETNYVLGTDGTDVGFFHWSGTTLKANRAYLAGESGSGVKGFYLDLDSADAIKSLVNGETSGEWYDLSGRRVAQPTRGLYIVNGKKVLVK